MLLKWDNVLNEKQSNRSYSSEINITTYLQKEYFFSAFFLRVHVLIKLSRPNWF